MQQWGMPTRSSKARSLKRQGTPHDFTVVARRVVEQAIDEHLDGTPLENPDQGKNPHAVALGKLGGPKGGKARAEKLTAEQRIKIARNAAQLRWRVREK